MSKPLAFRFMGWLAGCFAPVTLHGLLRRTLMALIFSLPPTPWRIKSLLRRILEYQGLPASRRRLGELADEMAEHYTRLIVSLCHFCQGASPPPPLEPVIMDFMPQAELLRRAGRGVILATPHFGDIYNAIFTLGHAGAPLNVLMLGGFNYAWAEFKRLRFLTLSAGAADCLKALAANELVLLHDDLDFFPGGRAAELFGAPVFPPHGPARLSLASGAPVLPVYAVFREGRTHLECDEPIRPEGQGQEELESRLLRSLERFIGRYPAQWLVFDDIWDLAHGRRHARWMRGLTLETQRRARQPGGRLFPWF